MSDSLTIRHGDKSWWILCLPDGKQYRRFKRLKDVVKVCQESSREFVVEGIDDLEKTLEEGDRLEGPFSAEMDQQGLYVNIEDGYGGKVVVYFNEKDMFGNPKLTAPTVNWSARGERSLAETIAYSQALLYACQIAKEGVPDDIQSV